MRLKSIFLVFFSSLASFSADFPPKDGINKVLEESCKIGGANYYFENGKNPFAIHARNSRQEIMNFLEDSKGTVVILGPGPALDIPLFSLIAQFDKIILIDGYIAPMQEYQQRLLAGLGKKVEIIQEDLSGGLGEFLEIQKEALIKALSIDFLNYLNGDAKLANYQELLNKEAFSNRLFIDIAQYKPDVVVSSLVTSQTAKVFDLEAKKLIKEAIKNIRFPHDSHTLNHTINCFYKELENINQRIVHPVYLNAIRTCGAQKIYYADTNEQEDSSIDVGDENIYLEDLVDPEHLRQFVRYMAPHYDIEQKDDAWDYHASETADTDEYRREEMPVSWIKFSKKQSLPMDLSDY